MIICFPCLVAFESNLPTGAYSEHIAGVTDRPLQAYTIYNGKAMCIRHVNVERGLPAEFLKYPPQEPGT